MVNKRRPHIRTTRPRLKVTHGWSWRVIVIDELGYVDWDDYKYPDQIILGTRAAIGRLLQAREQEPISLQVLRTAANLLMNYVQLAPGVPTRMHFTDDYYVEREIADKETGKPKRIKSLVLWVDELEGEDCARTFSILSQKLSAHLEPFLKDKGYLPYDFIITQMGDGFLKDWNVQVIRRPE